AEILRQAEGGHGELPLHHAVIKVVVKLLGGAVDLHPGKTLGEIVDHIVAAKLAVSDDIQAGDLLILDGSLDGGVMDLIEIVTADAPGKILGLEPLQPAGHRIAANDRGGKNGKSHQFTPGGSYKE